MFLKFMNRKKESFRRWKTKAALKNEDGFVVWITYKLIRGFFEVPIYCFVSHET